MAEKKAGGRLPAEYQEVEWIGKNGGNAYINTELSNLSDCTIEVSLFCNILQDQKIFGAWTNLASQGFAFGQIEQTWRAGIDRSWLTKGVATLNENHVVTVVLLNNLATISVDGVAFPTRNAQPYDKPITLLGVNRRGTIDSDFDGGINYAKFFSGDHVLAEFIPCYKKSNGEIGMYDTISQSFFTNAGTGTFTKGGNV